MSAFNSSSFSCDKNLEKINYISERTYMHFSEAKVEIDFVPWIHPNLNLPVAC